MICHGGANESVHGIAERASGTEAIGDPDSSAGSANSSGEKDCDCDDVHYHGQG